MSERASLTSTPKHRCAANGCKKMVSDRFLMCPTHWFKVPRDLQDAVYREYFAGLRRHIHPTDQYITVVDRAVQHVARVEGKIAA